MKRTLSVFFATFFLVSALIVPVDLVSATTDVYANNYTYSFKEEDVYSYSPLIKGSEDSGTLTFTPASNVGTASVVPLYGSTNYINKWGGISASYESINVDGKNYDSVNVTSGNDVVFVPVTSEGKPFELAPGHTYTVTVAYAHTGNMTNDNWYAQRGFFVSGGLYMPDDNANKYARHFAKVDAFGGTPASMPFGQKVDDLSNIDSTGIIEKTVTFTTPAATGAGYTYNADKNAYTTEVEYVSASGGGIVGEKITLDFYNYLYFYIDHYGSSKINITSLKITRDDYIVLGTVEYIDSDGSVMKSVTQNIGEYAIDFVPDNTADKYFAGWYLDEARTQRVETAKLMLSQDGLKLYAKWEDYKTSIVSTNHGNYYGITRVPHVTAAGVYNYRMSNRSNVNITTITTSNKEYLGVSTSFWGDGLLITASDDTTGELFRAKPNTTYKVSLKFRITAETSRSDGVDVNIAAGAGLPENANYPTGKYYDENNLKNRTAYTKYTDKITEDGKYETYTAIYTTGEFTTIPAIGVELWIYQDAAVEIYSLSVSEFDGEELADGEFLVSKEVKNNTTYLINFDYALNDTLSKDLGIGFKMTASDTVGYPTYVEGENVAIYTIKADKTVGEWFTAKVLITTDMTANVVNSFGYNDEVTALNSILYGYIISEDLLSVAIKNISICEVKDSAGNDLISVVGAQCLTSEAEQIAGSQALRYSFAYDSKTGNEIFISGTEYTVKERGFIYVNGNNYAKGGIYKSDFNLNNAKNGKYKFNAKTNDLDVCWKYSAINNTDLFSLSFSTYVKDFDVDDTKELMVKAYVIIEIDGQQFNVYSDSINRSVAYLKSLA